MEQLLGIAAKKLAATPKSIIPMEKLTELQDGELTMGRRSSFSQLDAEPR